MQKVMFSIGLGLESFEQHFNSILRAVSVCKLEFDDPADLHARHFFVLTDFILKFECVCANTQFSNTQFFSNQAACRDALLHRLHLRNVSNISNC